MKLSYFLFIALLFNVSYANIRNARQIIPKEFQKLNIENYLKNPRAVAFQLKCIIYDGPCDRIGKYLKQSIPEFLTNQCKSCDPDQKKKVGTLISFLQDNYPREWNDALKKFQSKQQITQEHIDKFEESLGIKLKPTGVPSKTGPTDLKNVANFLSQVGTQVSQNVKNNSTTPGKEGPIKTQSEFASSISGLINDLKNSSPKPLPVGETTDKVAALITQVKDIADKNKGKSFDQDAPTTQ